MSDSALAIVDASGNIINRVVVFIGEGGGGGGGWMPPEGCTTAEGPYEIGGTLIGGVYAPPIDPPQPPAPMQDISRRQFYQRLAVQSVITQTEAKAGIAGSALPASLQNTVNALPADQQFNAECLLLGAGSFQRNHPMTIAIGAAYGWSSEQIDAFFVAAAAL